MRKPDYQREGVTLYLGDCLEILPELEAGSVESVVTDPPYGLSFMGKDWDHGIPGVHFWQAIQAACKPGAMLLAFGGTRTHHRLWCAIEDAGWEIRDTIMWVYGSGFPKSCSISKQLDKAAGAEREVTSTYKLTGKARVLSGANYGGGYQDEYRGSPKDYKEEYSITAPATDAAKLWHGWGSSLKPSWEPVCVAMKPLDGTFAENALKHGVAGINVDGCRVGKECRVNNPMGKPENCYGGYGATATATATIGRWPANLIHDGSDEVVEGFPESKAGYEVALRGTGGLWSGESNFPCGPQYGDSGSAARFFYCAKADRTERGEGNVHPTVKPLALMEYLCKLTSTPTGGTVLDPFMGSGSTALACIRANRPFIGIELDPAYFQIAVKRIEAEFNRHPLFEQPKPSDVQPGLFT